MDVYELVFDLLQAQKVKIKTVHRRLRCCFKKKCRQTDDNIVKTWSAIFFVTFHLSFPFRQRLDANRKNKLFTSISLFQWKYEYVA